MGAKPITLKTQIHGSSAIKKKKGWWNKAGHLALDVAGLVPLVGNIADGANAAWYAGEGDYKNAALSAAAAIPGAGYAAFGAKMGMKGVKAAKAAKGAKVVAKNAKFFRSEEDYPSIKGPKKSKPNNTKDSKRPVSETGQEKYNKPPQSKNPGSGRIPQGASSWSRAAANNKSGTSLSNLVKQRNSAKKGSAEYAKAQNAINKAYGAKKRY